MLTIELGLANQLNLTIWVVISREKVIETLDNNTYFWHQFCSVFSWLQFL